MPHRTPRPCRLALAFAWVVMLLVTPAHAHGPASDDYRSEVGTIGPGDWPIFAEVKDGDDRLRVSNTGEGTLTVLDYEGLPYVRIGPDGVFVNRNSEAFYVNDERYGEVDIPEGTGDGPPRWKQEAEAGELPVYEFHDHRIHWMSRTPPPRIDTSNAAEQVVFDWEIPIRYEGQEGSIAGTLHYIGGSVPWWRSWPAVSSVAILVAAVLVIVVLRRRG